MVVIECSLILNILTNVQKNFILRWILSRQSSNWLREIVSLRQLTRTIPYQSRHRTRNTYAFLGGVVNFISSYAAICLPNDLSCTQKIYQTS